MARRVDMIGKTYGRLTTVSEVEPSRYNTGKAVRRFIFRCECGTTKEIDGHVVRNGSVSSCGCNLRESPSRFVHGHASKRTPEYKCWKGIMQRCENPKVKRFSDYGGRGICVCEKWRESFLDFFAYMGPKPSPQHSIDRINNDGNYEPTNCRWATASEQNKNQRKRRLPENKSSGARI